MHCPKYAAGSGGRLVSHQAELDVNTDVSDQTTPSRRAPYHVALLTIRHRLRPPGIDVDRILRDDPTEADLAGVEKLIAEANRERERQLGHLKRLDPDSAEYVYVEHEGLSARLRRLADEGEQIALRRKAWEVAQDRLAELGAGAGPWPPTSAT